MKLHVETDNDYVIYKLPKHVSKELMIEKLKAELSNSNIVFMELIDNGKSVFINKNKIVKIYIEENE